MEILMETTELNKISKDVSWADYFDSLINDAWLESRKHNSLGINFADLKAQKPETLEEMRDSKD
jgi:hypothetical protein